MFYQHNEPTEMDPVTFSDRQTNTYPQTLGRSLFSYFPSYQSLQISIINNAHRQDIRNQSVFLTTHRDNWNVKLMLPSEGF